MRHGRRGPALRAGRMLPDVAFPGSDSLAGDGQVMIKVSRASTEDREQAVKLLFTHLSQFEQARQTRSLLEASSRGDVDLRNLLVATLDEEPLGAGLMVAQSDGTMFVWPPSVAPGSAAGELTDAILDDMRRRVDRSGAWIAQCLTETDEHELHASLTRSGFRHLTDLLFLQRMLDEPLPERGDVLLETREFSRSRNFPRFVDMIEQTYVNTQDCPELNGVRSGVEALESHRAVGEFDPSRWKIYHVNGRDVGLLLMNEHTQQQAWEIVYVGTKPEERGRGYGRAILIDGLHEARNARVASLILAVDVRNSPARSLYESLRFRPMMARSVHIYSPRIAAEKK